MSLQSNLVHCIIAVAKHSPEIPKAGSSALHDFLFGAAQEMGARQLAAGSSDDHVHLLISIPTNLALSTVIDEIKMMSQRWLQGAVEHCRGFEWEHGFTMFSVGITQVRETVAYIDRQSECHRRMDYQRELQLFGEAYEMGLMEHLQS